MIDRLRARQEWQFFGAFVVEVGTHDDLLAKGGTYAELSASRPPPTADGLDRAADQS